MQRFEGFSACCSTYRRHDMSAAAVSAETAPSGTVKVDVRDDMRAVQANVRRDADFRLTISADAVSVDPAGDTVVEKKAAPRRNWFWPDRHTDLFADWRHTPEPLAVRIERVADAFSRFGAEIPDELATAPLAKRVKQIRASVTDTDR